MVVIMILSLISNRFTSAGGLV